MERDRRRPASLTSALIGDVHMPITIMRAPGELATLEETGA